MPYYPPASTSSSSSTPGEDRAVDANFTLGDGFSLVVADFFEATSGVTVELAADSVVEVIT